MANRSQKTITIFQKNYHLPILEDNSFRQIQSKIAQRQQIIHHQKKKKKLIWLIPINQKLSFEDKFHELEKLLNDYTQLINIVTNHRELYIEFVVQLIKEFKKLIKEKLTEINQQEKERLELLAEEMENSLIDILQGQKLQIVNNFCRSGSVILLVLNRIDIMNKAIAKMKNAQDEQSKLVETMVEKLDKYKKVYNLQKRIKNSDKEIPKLDFIVKLDDYLDAFNGSFQWLINRVREQDKNLSNMAQEIKKILEINLKLNHKISFQDKDFDVIKILLDFLILDTKVKERLFLNLSQAKQQEIDWNWENIDVKDCRNLTKAIWVLEDYLEQKLREYTKEFNVSPLKFFKKNIVSPPQNPSETLNKKLTDSLPTKITYSFSVDSESSLNNNAIQLKSEKNIDYQPLETLLSQRKWREADEKTADLMLQAMEEDSWVSVYSDDLLNFPKTDLKTIDQLWLKYSCGKFGFSVQKQIWIDCGGKDGKYDYDIYCQFADKIGWREKGIWLFDHDLKFTSNAPQAHLPAMGVWWVRYYRHRYLPSEDIVVVSFVCVAWRVCISFLSSIL